MAAVAVGRGEQAPVKAVTKRWEKLYLAASDQIQIPKYQMSAFYYQRYPGKSKKTRKCSLRDRTEDMLSF